MDEPTTLQERAKSLREARGLTQKELADLAGVSPTHVYQIEHGLRKQMHLNTLIRYAKALDVSPFYLDPQTSEVPADEVTFPDIAVALRHTSQLNSDQIKQVVRFVRALEAEQELARMTNSTEVVERDALGSKGRRRTG